MTSPTLTAVAVRDAKGHVVTHALPYLSSVRTRAVRIWEECSPEARERLAGVTEIREANTSYAKDDWQTVTLSIFARYQFFWCQLNEQAGLPYQPSQHVVVQDTDTIS